MTHPASRQRHPPDIRRAAILRAAKMVMSQKGYEATSLRDIANELGITKAGLYYYFKSKDDLLVEMLRAILDNAMENLKATDRPDADPLTRLWHLVDRQVRNLCENIVDTTVYLDERKYVPKRMKPPFLQKEAEYVAVFTQAIEAGRKAGQIRPEVDPEYTVMSLLGTANWIYTWYSPTGGITKAYLGAQFADIFINSVAVDAVPVDWPHPSRSNRYEAE